jgi:hypothetical protein
MKLKETREVVVNADDVKILRESINTIKKNREAVLVAKRLS